MNVPLKLTAFAVALAAALGAGAAIGDAAGPIDVDGDEEHVVEHSPGTTVTTTAGHDDDGLHGNHWEGDER